MLLRKANEFSLTGRTTFVNTLCGKRVLYPKEADDAANAHLEEGVRIKPVTVGELYDNYAQYTHRSNIDRT